MHTATDTASKKTRQGARNGKSMSSGKCGAQPLGITSFSRVGRFVLGKDLRQRGFFSKAFVGDRCRTKEGSCMKGKVSKRPGYWLQTTMPYMVFISASSFSTSESLRLAHLIAADG